MVLYYCNAFLFHYSMFPYAELDGCGIFPASQFTMAYGVPHHPRASAGKCIWDVSNKSVLSKYDYTALLIVGTVFNLYLKTNHSPAFNNPRNTNILDPQKVASKKFIVVLQLCVFSCNRMQSVQNLGLALISMLGGLIVEKKGYLILEMFYLVWLCGMLLYTSVLFLLYLSFSQFNSVCFSLPRVLSVYISNAQLFIHYYGTYSLRYCTISKSVSYVKNCNTVSPTFQ